MASTSLPVPSQLQLAVLRSAASYVGLSEVKSNDRWDDLATKGPDASADRLRKGLLTIGWEPGYAYCIGFTKLIWREAFTAVGRAADFASLSRLIGLGVVDSFNRLREAGRITTAPKPGAMFFLRHGTTGNGHAGIGVAFGTKEFATIEANTSPTSADVAKDREGDGIYAKTRPLDYTKRASGLYLLGFCNPE